MSKRVCVEAGCPELIDQGRSRCRAHERELDRERGTPAERGYDREYERAKRQPEYRDATLCATCGEPFTRDNPKTAGHKLDIRTYGPNNAGIIPECRTCNYGWRRARE